MYFHQELQSGVVDLLIHTPNGFADVGSNTDRCNIVKSSFVTNINHHLLLSLDQLYFCWLCSFKGSSWTQLRYQKIIWFSFASWESSWRWLSAPRNLSTYIWPRGCGNSSAQCHWGGPTWRRWTFSPTEHSKAFFTWKTVESQRIISMW